MQSMFGDRFLKKFFGSRLHRRTINPASETMILPDYETGEPDEPEDATIEYPPEADATLEPEQTGELNQPAGAEKASTDQTTAANHL